tara:strand:- start:1210 stop:2613 length:1404 start_codon:yes stop_codon:yes gene_type:complete
MAYHNNPRLAGNEACVFNVDAATVHSSSTFTNTNIQQPDYPEWNTGSSSKEGYNENGSGENYQVKSRDPYGRTCVIWEARNNDVGSNADGGWEGLYYNIDRTKKYRFTYFFKPVRGGTNGITTNGYLYFGLYAANASSSDRVHHYNGTGSQGNPYFAYPAINYSGFNQNEWYMVIAYVLPDGTGANAGLESDIGFYRMCEGSDATAFNANSGNFGRQGYWADDTTRVRTRNYLYYSTTPDAKVHWFAPRIDVCEGNEPTVAEMLTAPQDWWHDSSRNAINLKAQFSSAGSPAFTTSNGAKCFDFDGTNWFQGPNDTSLDNNTLTIQAWVKTDATTQNGFIFEKGAVNTQYALFQEGANFTFRTVVSSSYDSLTFATADYMNTSTWYMITATYDGGYKKMYVNTTERASSSYPSKTLDTNTYGVNVGRHSTGYYYNGKIGAVRVYNRALTVNEITQNFNTHKARYGLA